MDLESLIMDGVLKLETLLGEAFGITLRYFNKCGFRLLLNFNTDFLIKIFGFNQKIIGV